MSSFMEKHDSDEIVRYWLPFLSRYLLAGTADTIERQVRAHAHEVALGAISLHLITRALDSKLQEI